MSLNRANTLSRPDRAPGPAKPMVGKNAQHKKTSWVVFSRIVTFWAWPAIMAKCGMRDPSVQQAWREKVSLVFLIMLVCAFVAFFTLGLQDTLCGPDARNPARFVDHDDPSFTSIFGRSYNIQEQPPEVQEVIIENDGAGRDLTGVLYSQTDSDSPFADLKTCDGLNSDWGIIEYEGACEADGSCIDRAPVPGPVEAKITEYKWGDVYSMEYMFALDGTALNFERYLTEVYPDPDARPNDKVDAAIRFFVSSEYRLNDIPARDITRFFLSDSELIEAIPCLKMKFKAGVVEKSSTECFLADLIYWSSLVVILSLIFARFTMAVVFGWFLSPRIAAPPTAEKLARIKSGAEGMARAQFTTYDKEMDPTTLSQMELNHVAGTATTNRNMGAGADDDPRELYTVLLVTAYSEGEEGLRTTCDSLASTQYADHKKLIFVVADGYVKGDGNDKTTPEVVIDIMDIDNHFGEDPEPQSYIAIATGKKQHNRAKIYIGHYNCGGHRTPMMLVAKCGSEAEKGDRKPGNRGKRDSQIILMHFFSRIMVNERMTPCDADLFRKIHYLMGVTADRFEMVLMVDADTMVYPDSLPLLINAAQNDQAIMGLCGETKIANKRSSWVTWIQVFEYYISHHLGKGFESVFGGVTCLPGCFCMYRLKVRKGPNSWVPILANRDIADEYSSNITETLHQKNLLLLGEDRFLTTVMLRTFPQRKMMFVPQAICKTIIPDTFKVLLSQRRRWINSTVHNLMELVLVRALCGVFCCSMQFVVALEIIGTVSLPVAIFLTYILIIRAPLDLVGKEELSPGDFFPLILLVLILFSPAVLIMLTTLKVVYLGWMMAYLIIGLPVWNFVLPVYAYWHFDDFSWGETRKVEGAGKDSHGEKDGDFDFNAVPLKRWEEWEKLYRKREARKRGDPSDTTLGGASGTGTPGMGTPVTVPSFHTGTPPPGYNGSFVHGANVSSVSGLSQQMFPPQQQVPDLGQPAIQPFSPMYAPQPTQYQPAQQQRHQQPMQSGHPSGSNSANQSMNGSMGGQF